MCTLTYFTLNCHLVGMIQVADVLKPTIVTVYWPKLILRELHTYTHAQNNDTHTKVEERKTTRNLFQ